MPEPKPSPSDAPSALPRIEGYRIEGVLGRGSTGVVYSAVQVAVDRPVALKLLHRELMGNRRAVRRLQREARTAAKLAHPAIISAIDMGESAGRWWYAMELVEGISLGERLEEQGLLSEREALRFFAPVVDALQYASEAGVTHRDVKPANILVDPHGKARVVDLGLAIAEDDPALTSPGGTLGTPHYISPEQAKDPSNADTRSDIYSLGATMYHALCGRPPFQGSSVAEVLSAVLYHRVPDPRGLRPELSKGIALVLRKCLARDPERRYAEPRELAADLERLQERRAPEVSSASLDPLPGERRGQWRIAAALGALALAGGAAWALWPVADAVAPGAAAPEQPEPFAELAALRARFAGNEVNHREVLEVLSDWLSLRGEAGVSAGQRVQARAFHAEILADLDLELERAREALRSSYGERVEQGSLESARVLVAESFGARLKSATGYMELSQLPGAERVDTWTRWRRELTAEADAAVEQAYGQRVDRVARFVDSELTPSVSHDLAQRRFQAALQRLGSGAGALLDAAGVTAAGLSEDELLARVGARVEPALEQLRRDVRFGWNERDRELASALKERAAALESVLELDPTREPTAELQLELERLLLAGGPELDQIPEGWELRHQMALFDAQMRLRIRRQELLEGAARADLERDSVAVDQLLVARDYSAAIKLWEERLAATWREPVHAAMQLRLAEAQLLQRFLERVAQGLRAGHLGRAALYHRSIPRTGTLQVLADPLLRSFRLRLAGRAGEGSELVFALRRDEGARPAALVATPDMEAFAQRGDGPPPKPLALAIFRFYEGDLDGAGRLLGEHAAGPREGVDSAEAELWARLGARIRQRRTDASDARGRRLAELDEELRSLMLDSSDKGTSGADIRRRVEGLRRTYRGLLSSEHEARLASVLERAAKRTPRPDLAEAFPAAHLVLGTRRGSYRPVSLTWEFADPSPGAWSLGPFSIEEDSLVQRNGLGSLPAWLAPSGGAILPLMEPLVPANSLRVEMRFRLPAGSRPNNEIMVSLAGYTVVFLDYLDQPRFFGGPGERGDVLEQARGTDRGSFNGFSGLDRNLTHTLILDVDPEGAQVLEMRLGEESLTFPRTYPAGEARQGGSVPTVEIRSLQGIEIRSVKVSTNARL